MLAILRVVFIFCYFLLANAVLILLCLIRPFHRDNVYLVGKVYGLMAKMVGMRVQVRVPASVQNGGPYVYIANHQNSLDLITVCMAAQKGVVTVGKKSLVWIPVFGWLYWLSGNILIDRKNKGRAHDTLKQTVDKINQRRLSVFFFPEGTRSYGRGLLPFKTGAFRIAKAVNESVVMVCTSSLMKKVKLNRWDNGTLIIDLLEPVALDDSRDAKQWADYFHQKMRLHIEQLDAEVATLESGQTSNTTRG